MGGTKCIDYSSRPLTVGFLHWAGLDFGDQLSLNNHLRTALYEHDKRERNQCLILHLPAAYECFPNGVPGDLLLHRGYKPLLSKSGKLSTSKRLDSVKMFPYRIPAVTSNC